MGTVTLPYNPQPGDPEDITQITADLAAIVTAINGNLDAVNVTTAAAVAQGSTNANGAGTASTLARSDHTHLIRGLERLAADPSTSNFVGRRYHRTTDNLERLCIDATGSGTWVTAGNYAAADLPTHASRHASGGTDALPTGAITDPMVNRTRYRAVPAADVSPAAATWTNFVTLTGVVVTGTQTVLVMGTVKVSNGGAAIRTCGMRVQRRINAGAYATEFVVGTWTMPASGTGGDNQNVAFTESLSLGVGTHDFKLDVYADAISVNFVKTPSFGTESGPGSRLLVVVGG